MSTWLLTELILSTGAVVFTLLAVSRNQVASRGFKLGAVIAAVGLAGHTLLEIYQGLGGLSEAALTVQALVFANAVACAVLMARLPTPDARESTPG